MFHEIIHLPEGSRVFDFSGEDFDVNASYGYGIGKYDERRPSVYKTDLFKSDNSDEVRCIHLGVDLFGPVGTPVYSFADAEITHFGYNATKGDYGYVLVLRVALTEALSLYALYGHLSKESVDDKYENKKVRRVISLLLF
jgi:murein DD-endopeptidase MepM/ murein hydrolase activator NlpD